MGYSVGHWDGNTTFVVEAVGFNEKTWLDRLGHAHSEQLHVTERFRRVDRDHLELDITMTDPKALAKPWTTTFYYQNRPKWELGEISCSGDYSSRPNAPAAVFEQTVLLNFFHPGEYRSGHTLVRRVDRKHFAHVAFALCEEHRWAMLKKELVGHLRSKRRMRRSRHSRDRGHHSGQIVDAISIRERPAEVEDRSIPGHWEGDLLSGAKNSYIATLVERRLRFAMLIKVPSKDTGVVVAALSRRVRKLPATLRRSLTWDRGLEMAEHKTFTVATDVKVYFCDPQSPWQRGTNENTNLLLRQYFPRGTDLSGYSQAQLDRIALRLNQRPRKTLGFETPASRLQASVASTV